MRQFWRFFSHPMGLIITDQCLQLPSKIAFAVAKVGVAETAEQVLHVLCRFFAAVVASIANAVQCTEVIALKWALLYQIILHKWQWTSTMQTSRILYVIGQLAGSSPLLKTASNGDKSSLSGPMPNNVPLPSFPAPFSSREILSTQSDHELSLEIFKEWVSCKLKLV